MKTDSNYIACEYITDTTSVVIAKLTPGYWIGYKEDPPGRYLFQKVDIVDYYGTAMKLFNDLVYYGTFHAYWEKLDLVRGMCCPWENRSIRGGCLICGDPCL